MGNEFSVVMDILNLKSSLNLQWVRHMEDGSFNFIEGNHGCSLLFLFTVRFVKMKNIHVLMMTSKVLWFTGAKQPNYLVTADDVDTCLAIEVQPLDNRKRKVLLLLIQLLFQKTSRYNFKIEGLFHKNRIEGDIHIH